MWWIFQKGGNTDKNKMTVPDVVDTALEKVRTRAPGLEQLFCFFFEHTIKRFTFIRIVGHQKYVRVNFF